MSFTIWITMLVMTICVCQDQIGSEITTVKNPTNSLDEGEHQISTAMPDGENSLTTNEAQTVVNDPTLYSSTEIPLDGNQSTTSFPNEEDTETNTGTRMKVQDASSINPPNDSSAFSSTNKRGLMVQAFSTPIFPEIEEFQAFKNSPSRELAFDVTPEKPVGLAAFENSTDTMEFNLKGEGLVSTTNDPKASNGRGTSIADKNNYVELVKTTTDNNATNSKSIDVISATGALKAVANESATSTIDTDKYGRFVSETTKPKAAVNESVASKASTDGVDSDANYDGPISATEEPNAAVNENGSSGDSSVVSDAKNEGLISKEVWDAFNDVAGDLWLPICAIGIVANVFNIIVFMDRRMRNATNYYLTAINVFQISYIISSTLTKTHQLIYGTLGQRSTRFFYEGAIYVNNYIGVVFNRAVFCMVMVVSLERMMAIVFPLRRARSRLVKSPIPCTLCLIITLFLFHLSSVLKYSVEQKNENGKISYDLKPRGYNMDVLNMFSLISKILFVYLPLLGILICNTILCVALKRHSQFRVNLQEMTGEKRLEARERQTTVAILVSTCVFFVLVLPVSTNSIVSNLLRDYGYFGQNRYTFLFMQRLGSLLDLASFSTDFITYVTISSKYRETLVRRCFPCLITSKMIDSVQSTMKRGASTKQSIHSSSENS